MTPEELHEIKETARASGSRLFPANPSFPTTGALGRYLAARGEEPLWDKTSEKEAKQANAIARSEKRAARRREILDSL